jgi:predicted  nucleic acid-binding Zn-ribbon protein
MMSPVCSDCGHLIADHDDGWYTGSPRYGTERFVTGCRHCDCHSDPDKSTEEDMMTPLIEQIADVLRRCPCAHGGCTQQHPEWDQVVAEQIAEALTA